MSYTSQQVVFTFPTFRAVATAAITEASVINVFARWDRTVPLFDHDWVDIYNRYPILPPYLLDHDFTTTIDYPVRFRRASIVDNVYYKQSRGILRGDQQRVIGVHVPIAEDTVTLRPIRILCEIHDIHGPHDDTVGHQRATTSSTYSRAFPLVTCLPIIVSCDHVALGVTGLQCCLGADIQGQQGHLAPMDVTDYTSSPSTTTDCLVSGTHVDTAITTAIAANDRYSQPRLVQLQGLEQEQIKQELDKDQQAFIQRFHPELESSPQLDRATLVHHASGECQAILQTRTRPHSHIRLDREDSSADDTDYPLLVTTFDIRTWWTNIQAGIKPERGDYICELHNVSFTLSETWKDICPQCAHTMESTPNFDADSFGRCIQGGLPLPQGDFYCQTHCEFFTLRGDPSEVCPHCFEHTFRGMLEARQLSIE